MAMHHNTSRLPRVRQTWARRGSPAPQLSPLTLKPTPRAIKAHLLDHNRMPAAAKRAAAAISEQGFCVCRGGIDSEVVAEARREIEALFRHGAMSPGGFTIAGRDDLVKAMRDDHTLWLNEYLFAVGGPEKGGAQTVTALDQCLAQFGEAVGVALSELDRPNEPMSRGPDGGQLCYTGRTDLMLACYPGGGAAYGPHVDNADGDGRKELDFGRCYTLVYYLNDEDWAPEEKGGALRLHLAPELGGSSDGRWPPSASVTSAPHDVIDVCPRGDTLIMFRADKLLHEVCPAHAKRFAATLWLYGGSRKAAKAQALAAARGKPR